MAETTHISWCDATHNDWIGCTKVSDACTGCYAEHLMDTRHHRVVWGKPGQHGTLSRTAESNRRKPLTWERKAAAEGARPFVFCSSLSDIFDKNAPLEWRRELFAMIRATPHLVWLLLTKRPQNIYQMVELAGGMSPNIAFGTTTEDQRRVDTNVPHLLEAQRRLKPIFTFLSCEPLLERITIPYEAFGTYDITIPEDRGTHKRDIGFSPETTVAGAVSALGGTWNDRPGIGWVITGGETDQGVNKARPSHPDWFRSLRDQCQEYGIPYHHKQNGEWLGGDQIPEEETIPSGISNDCGIRGASDNQRVWRVGKKRAGRLLDGLTHDARPEVPRL